MCIVNAADGKVKQQIFLSHDGLEAPTSMAWSPSGTKLAASCNQRVHIVDAATGAIEHEVHQHGFTGEVDWSPSGTIVSNSYGEDGEPMDETGEFSLCRG